MTPLSVYPSQVFHIPYVLSQIMEEIQTETFYRSSLCQS